MTKKKTYTKVDDNLCRIVGANAAMIVGKVTTLTAHEESCTLSLAYLAELLGGVSEDTVRRSIKKLEFLGYIEYTPVHGRGLQATFKKGTNLLPFIEKTLQNNEVLDEKTLQKSPKNLAKTGGINNNEIIAATPAHGCVRAVKDAAADGELEKGSPRQRKVKKMIQQQFEEFWTLFAAKDEYRTRKERCERVWYATSPERREAFIKVLRAGKKHRDNPLHYLQYDTPEEAKAEFPIFVNGDVSIAIALHDAENGGRPLAFVRGGLQLHINDNFAYIYLDDAIAQKIRVIRTIPRQAIEQVPAELRENQHRQSVPLYTGMVRQALCQ